MVTMLEIFSHSASRVPSVNVGIVQSTENHCKDIKIFLEKKTLCRGVEPRFRAARSSGGWPWQARVLADILTEKLYNQ